MTKNFNEILQKTINEGLSEIEESVTQWVRFHLVSSFEEYMMFPHRRFLKRKRINTTTELAE